MIPQYSARHDQANADRFSLLAARAPSAALVNFDREKKCKIHSGGGNLIQYENW